MTPELLLGLAGRVDDDLLTWARELVVVGEDARAVELLTAALIADRVALPEPVRAALVAAGRAGRIVLDADAALPAAHDEDGTSHVFAAPRAGAATAAVAAAVRGLLARSGIDGRAWLAWRCTPAGSATGPLPRPVVLVELTGSSGDVLAHELGTALERAGVPASVEVVERGAALPPYHAAARRTGWPLGTAPAAASTPSALAGAAAVPGSVGGVEPSADPLGPAPFADLLGPVAAADPWDVAPPFGPAPDADVLGPAATADPSDAVPAGDPLDAVRAGDPLLDGDPPSAEPATRRLAGLGPIGAEPRAERAGVPASPPWSEREPAPWSAAGAADEPRSSLFTPASAAEAGQARRSAAAEGRAPDEPLPRRSVTGEQRHGVGVPEPGGLEPAEPIRPRPSVPAVVSVWWAAADTRRADPDETDTATSGSIAPIRRLRPAGPPATSEADALPPARPRPIDAGAEYGARPYATEALPTRPGPVDTTGGFPASPPAVDGSDELPRHARPIPGRAEPPHRPGPVDEPPDRSRPAGGGVVPMPPPRPGEAGGPPTRTRPRPPARPMAEDPLSGPLREPLLAPLLDPTVDEADPLGVDGLFTSPTASTGGFDPVRPTLPAPPPDSEVPRPPFPAAPRPTDPGPPPPRPVPVPDPDGLTPPDGEVVIDPARLGLRPDSVERLSPTDRALLARLQNELGIRPPARPAPLRPPAPRPRPLRVDPPDIAG